MSKPIELVLDGIKTADWTIYIGHEGGVEGVEIVTIGTPEDVVMELPNFTGPYFRSLLKLKMGHRQRS